MTNKPRPDRLKVSEEEMIKLTGATSESSERYLRANFLDGTIAVVPENLWAVQLLAEWRRV